MQVDSISGIESLRPYIILATVLNLFRSVIPTQGKKLRFRFWKKKPNPILQILQERSLQDKEGAKIEFDNAIEALQGMKNQLGNKNKPKTATKRDYWQLGDKCPKCGGFNFEYLPLYNLWECQSFLGDSSQRCGELLGIQIAPDWKELNGSKTGFCPFCGSADVYQRSNDWCCRHCSKAFPWPSHLNKPLPPK